MFFLSCNKDEFVLMDDNYDVQEEFKNTNSHLRSMGSKAITLSSSDQELIKSSLSGFLEKNDDDVKLVIDSILTTQALAVISGENQILTFYYNNNDLDKTFNLVFEKSNTGILNGYLHEIVPTSEFYHNFSTFSAQEDEFQGKIIVKPLSAIASIVRKNTDEDCFEVVFDNLDYSTTSGGSGGGNGGSNTNDGPNYGGNNNGVIIFTGGNTNTNNDDGGTKPNPPNGGNSNNEPCLEEYVQVIDYDWRGRNIGHRMVLVRTGNCPDENLVDEPSSGTTKNLSTNCQQILEQVGVLLRPLEYNVSGRDLDRLEELAQGLPYHITALATFIDMSAVNSCIASGSDGSTCIRQQIKTYLEETVNAGLAGTLHHNFSSITDDEVLADFFHPVYASNGNPNVSTAARYVLANRNNPHVQNDRSGQITHLAIVAAGLAGQFDQYADAFSRITGALCGKISNNELQMLIRRPEEVNSMDDFINEADDTPGALDYLDFTIKMIDQDERRIFDRFEELYNLVENDPDALVEDCAPSISDWSDLASFTVSGAPLQRIEDSDGYWDVQNIQDASGARVNLDYFSIHLEELPYINGSAATPQQLFDYFRININNFADKFSPFSPNDVAMWESNNPLTTVMEITMVTAPITNAAIADGDVICSQYDPCCWIFTTLHSPAITGSGYHPVSGNRKFGYTYEDGVFVLYTQGADRTTTWYHSLNESARAFSEADALWRNMQEKFIADIEDNGGWTIPGNNRTGESIIRPDWQSIKESLISSTPITSVPCN